MQRLALAALTVAACAHPAPPPAPTNLAASSDDDAWSVVPGRSIGRATLGDPIDTVIARLGPPTARVDARGLATALVWLGDARAEPDDELEPGFAPARDTLIVLVEAGRVVQIEASSPRYRVTGEDRRARHTRRAWVAANTDEGMATPACKHVLLVDDEPDLGVARKYGTWGCAAPEPDPDGPPEAIVIHAAGVAPRADPIDALPYAGHSAHSYDFPSPTADAFFSNDAIDE